MERVVIGSLAIGGLLLWNSNRELTASLDDVEARVEFMTRELPASLAPLGRMDLLDKVFQNVSEHYEKNGRRDSESLARHADLLTQWAHTLEGRGKTSAMVERLESALEKAEAAVALGEPPVDVARAREILDETAIFAERHPFEDLKYRVLLAELASELMILEANSGDQEKAVENPTEESILEEMRELQKALIAQ